MTLSTADSHAAVTSRIVLLKSVDGGRFTFFTNYDSIKGQQIAENPNVSLCFYWPHLERQIRIEGRAEKTDRETTQAYFHSRPRDSQIGANVSPQSREVETEDWLDQKMNSLKEKFADGPIPCPTNWGGYTVTPTQIEFWQGRPSRLHDRITYKWRGDEWRIVRLAP